MLAAVCRLLDRPTDRVFLIAVLALALVLRLPLFALDVGQTSDFAWYYSAARSIAAGQGYAEDGVPTAFWPVGWPGFLAGLLWVFGPGARVGQCTNLALSAGVIILIRYVGASMLPDARVWRIGALIIAVLPNQIAYVPLLSVEIFFEFLLMLGFLLIVSGRAVLAGSVFGLACLTKSQSVLLPAMIVVPLLRQQTRRCAGLVAVTGFGIMVTVLPWTMRNYAVFQAIVPVATNGGINLLLGNNPSAAGGFTPDDALLADLSMNPRHQIETDQVAGRRAIDWIIANPDRFALLLPQKFEQLWWIDGEAEWLYQKGYAYYDQYVLIFRIVRIVNQAMYVGVMAAAVAGIPAMWRRRRSLPAWCWSGWTMAGYVTAISLEFFGQARFHFALMPFFALYAAWTMSGILPAREAALSGPNPARQGSSA